LESLNALAAFKPDSVLISHRSCEPRLERMSKMPKKKAKNQNTLKHGIYSRQVMLPGEKIRDYEALHQDHFDEWVPDGVTEQYLVDELCKLRWKKR
jgi:hypothetical protein